MLAPDLSRELDRSPLICPYLPRIATLCGLIFPHAKERATSIPTTHATNNTAHTLGWLLLSYCQHDRHDQKSYTGEEVGADGYKAGGDSPELQSNE
jgi:hypothetical protein